MKLRLTLIWLGALVAGCATPTGGDYCDVAAPIYLRSDAVVDWLEAHDPDALRGVVTANEVYAALCPRR